jgi:hypothetical protein
MIFNELTPDNWLLFAIKNYNNPLSVTYDDFEEDLQKFKYIKRLLRRYDTTTELKHHLILNHIITLYNVFNDAATLLLFYKIESQYWPILKAFMIFLDRLPEDVDTTDVDEQCLKLLTLL